LHKSCTFEKLEVVNGTFSNLENNLEKELSKEYVDLKEKIIQKKFISLVFTNAYKILNVGRLNENLNYLAIMIFPIYFKSKMKK
jgi:hypothetical protein